MTPTPYIYNRSISFLKKEKKNLQTGDKLYDTRH